MNGHITDIYYEVSLTCRVIRVGSFKFINAPNSKVNQDLKSNLKLCSDGLSMIIGDEVELHLSSSDIRDIWTYTGRKLPKAFICMHLKQISVCKVERFFKSEELEYDPASADLDKKYIVLFPSDESIQDFITAQDSISWIKGAKVLTHSQAQELVLATAGQKKEISFCMDTLLPHNTNHLLLAQSPKLEKASKTLFVSPAAAVIINKREIKNISLQTKGRSLLKRRKKDKEGSSSKVVEHCSEEEMSNGSNISLEFDQSVGIKPDLIGCDFYSSEVIIENE